MNDLGLGVQFKSDGALGGFVEAIYTVDFTDESATLIVTLQAGVQLFVSGTRSQ